VTEAMDKVHQQYSEDRLKQTILGSLANPAREIKERILEDVRVFVGQEPPSDDLTLLVLKQV